MAVDEPSNEVEHAAVVELHNQCVSDRRIVCALNVALQGKRAYLPSPSLQIFNLPHQHSINRNNSFVSRASDRVPKWPFSRRINVVGTILTKQLRRQAVF